MNHVEMRAAVAVKATAMLEAIEAQQRPSAIPGWDAGPDGTDGHPWPPVQEGARHGAIIAAAGFCRQRRYSLNHAILVIQDWNRGNRPPESTAEVQQQVRDVYRRYQDGDPVDQPEPFVKLSEFWGKEHPPREWLIPGFLPAGQRVAIVGKWGDGKSLAVMEAAHSLAYGSTFLGLTLPAANGNVVVLDGEGGRLRAGIRSNRLRAGRGLAIARDPGSPDIHWRAAGALSLSSGPAMEALQSDLVRLEPKMIIFDTLSKVLGVTDENSNAMAARVTQSLYALNQELGATLLSVAHPAKGQGAAESVRGAGELSADLDVIWSIRKNENDERVLRCRKDRDGNLEKAAFQFVIRDNPDGSLTLQGGAAESDRDVAEQTILDVMEGSTPLKSAEIVEHAMNQREMSRATVYRVLKRLERRGEIISAGGKWVIPEDAAAGD